MNDTVKRRLANVHKQVDLIAAEADYIKDDLITTVNESEDLPPIETALENIILWASEAKDYVRNTYDEFEED